MKIQCFLHHIENALNYIKIEVLTFHGKIF